MPDKHTQGYELLLTEEEKREIWVCGEGTLTAICQAQKDKVLKAQDGINPKAVKPAIKALERMKMHLTGGRNVFISDEFQYIDEALSLAKEE